MIPLYIEAAMTAIKIIQQVMQALSDHKAEMTPEQEAEFKKALQGLRGTFSDIAPFVKKNP